MAAVDALAAAWQHTHFPCFVSESRAFATQQPVEAEHRVRVGSAGVSGLVAWARHHGIEAMVAPFVHTTAAWIRSAAPEDATVEQRTLACIDLATCFFVIDDSPADDSVSRIRDLELALAGAPAIRPLHRALLALFDRLGNFGVPLDHYRAVRSAFAAAMRTRTSPLGSEAYFALRQTTIYFEPWLSTWEILHGIALDAPDRARLRPVFEHACRWQVLENEIASLHRDRAAHHPNVISLIAAERDIELGGAVMEVAVRARAEWQAFDGLQLADPSPALARCIATITRAVRGARAHHVDGADPERYRSTV